MIFVKYEKHTHVESPLAREIRQWPGCYRLAAHPVAFFVMFDQVRKIKPVDRRIENHIGN